MIVDDSPELPSSYFQTLAKLNLSHQEVAAYASRMYSEEPTTAAAINRWLRSVSLSQG